MSLHQSTHNISSKRPNLNLRNLLETIEEHDHSMELEDLPVKESRRRASTVGFESPNPRCTDDPEPQYTCDTYRRLKQYFNPDRDKEEANNQIYLDNVLEKLRAVRCANFLDQHHIQEKYRAKMIDWMVEVLNTYQQKEATLHRAIFLLDYYYHCAKAPEAVDDLHLTGIACMMIASKSEEINFISLDAFINTIGKNKFSKERLLRREIEVLSAIQFKTCGPTVFELIKCCVQVIEIKDRELKVFFEKAALMLVKMCLFSYQLLNSLPMSEVALYCIVIALKMSEKMKKFDSRPIVR